MSYGNLTETLPCLLIGSNKFESKNWTMLNAIYKPGFNKMKAQPKKSYEYEVTLASDV